MDIQLYYREEGIGEPLVLLHGNGEDGSYFEHQISYFKKKYRVIAVDTRGHGKSARGTAPFTIRQFAEDLREFLQEQGLERVNLLGFSDGGNIALIFAMRYPHMVKRLILNGANLNGKGVVPSVQIPIILGYKTASFFAKRGAKRNAEMLGLMVNDPNIAPEDLKQMHVRTLVIAGTKDMIKKEHTRLIYKNLPNAELAFVPGNHFIASKNPERFNAIVDKFLSEEDKCTM